MRRTLRSKKLRALLYYSQGGLCAICKRPLPDDWHADHIVPWVKSKRTNVHEMQALCPDCNLGKGAQDGDTSQVLDAKPNVHSNMGGAGKTKGPTSS